jgi:hypothetical protein
VVFPPFQINLSSFGKKKRSRRMYLYVFQGVGSLILEKKVAKINLEWREYYLSTNLIDLKTFRK